MLLIIYFWSNRFKNLTAEERVLCLTTVDKEICEIVVNDFCKR